MKIILLFLITFVFLQNKTNPQSFKSKIDDFQKFTFTDKIPGSQVLFSSDAPLEKINGTANNLAGTITFNNSNFAKSIKGKFVVQIKSLNTGIELRNHHLQSANWLNASKYPEIIFELSSITDLKQIEDNKMNFKATGAFTLHGITKSITADCETVYLTENSQTQTRAPGNLFGINVKFYLNMSDFNIDNSLIGNKVAERIEINATLIGSSKL